MSSTTHTDPQMLLDQLVEGRERLRAERAAAKAQIEDARKLQRDAKDIHTRARRSCARYLKRSRRKIQAERDSLCAAQREIARQQEELAQAFQLLQSERERHAAETRDDRAALQKAWELLNEHRNTFQNERAERDQELSNLFRLIDERDRETTSKLETLRDEQKKSESEVSVLRNEAAGLDRRIANARLQLKELETQRAQATVDRITAQSHRSELVSLAVTPEIPPTQLTALQIREDDLQRERRHLDLQRRELDKLAEHLGDQRRLLDEQWETIAATKDSWRTAESQTVDELEQLIHAVGFRESMLSQREAMLARDEDNRRERERELWKYQTALDQWHELLVEREARDFSLRQKSETELIARRARVADREAELNTICQKWNADHEQIRQSYLAAIAAYHEQSEQCRSIMTECETTRREVLDQAAKMASWILAAEQQFAENAKHPEHQKAIRRVNVLKKRWESRFARSLRAIDEQLTTIRAESSALTTRHGELQQLASRTTSEHQKLATSLRERDRDAALSHPLPAEEPIVLAVVDAWRNRSDGSIQKLRQSARIAADALLNTDAKADIIPLRVAKAC